MRIAVRETVAAMTAVAIALCGILSGEVAGQDQDAASVDAEKRAAVLIAKMAESDVAAMGAMRELVTIGGPAVPALMESTSHETPRVRYWSIAALSGIGEDRAVPAVKKCLNDRVPLVRAVAVWHLGRWFHREDVRQSVVETLEDPDDFVRGWALNLIRERNFKDAIPRLVGMLESTEEAIRYDALHTIALLEGPDSIPRLKKILQNDKSALVRKCALQCCTIINPPSPRTAEVLIVGLSDEDIQVRALAAELLRKGFDGYFGFNEKDPLREREKAVWLWQNWYRENKDRLKWDEKKRLFVIAQKAATREGAAEDRSANSNTGTGAED